MYVSESVCFVHPLGSDAACNVQIKEKLNGSNKCGGVEV